MAAIFSTLAAETNGIQRETTVRADEHCDLCTYLTFALLLQLTSILNSKNSSTTKER